MSTLRTRAYDIVRNPSLRMGQVVFGAAVLFDLLVAAIIIARSTMHAGLN